MERTIKYLALTTIVLVALFSSCEKEELPEAETGKLEIAVSLAGPELKSDEPDSTGTYPWHVLVTVINSLGEAVFDEELIPLYRFGNDFISGKIELKTGRYQLSQFLVINPEGKVVYAAPREGSPKAYLAKDPLPKGFSILPGESTRVIPEVFAVVDSAPEDFGYASFGFQVIRTLPFFVMAVIDDSMLMAPLVPVPARLHVESPDGWMHDYHLEPQINQVVIRGGVRYYLFVAYASGCEPVRFEVRAERLKLTSRENPLILRFSRTGYNVLDLQPGPENGKDAMILDIRPEDNFGDHRYFEATYESDSLLTVMRTSRSLIHFNPVGLPGGAQIRKVILTLYYDVPVPWDTVVYDSTVNAIDPACNCIPGIGAILQQIVEPWEEHRITWENQPATIEANQVFIPPFIKNADFIDVDVTSLFVPIREIAAANYGMMLRIWPTEEYPGFRFASSDYEVPRMRPRLRILYTLQDQQY